MGYPSYAINHAIRGHGGLLFAWHRSFYRVPSMIAQKSDSANLINMLSLVCFKGIQETVDLEAQCN